MIMSIVPLFPGTSNHKKAGQDDFEREVAARFGLVPNFFRSAPEAPLVVRDLWAFAKSAYLDTPIPTLFKERLFVYLSRFCEVRYCITRHCGFLLGLGRAAGDSNAQAMTISQVIRLLQRPLPTAERTEAALARLEAVAEPIDWPSPETSYDDDLLTSATVLFLQPARAVRAKHVLRIALGGEKFELLVAFLTFVRSAHYWTLMHPELALEDDVKALLREHEELARMLLEDSEAGHCEMGTRLFEELESLRDLNERQELEKAKRALEESGRQKDLLIKEVDHRVKNSSKPISKNPSVHIVLKDSADSYLISVCDPGDGPDAAQGTADLGTRHAGLGTRIVETLARQINATITNELSVTGYKITITVPKSAVSTLN